VTLEPLPDEPAPFALRGLRLLVVEDNEDARRAFAALLEQYGARVRSASSVTQAIEALAGERPDCVICDLVMPAQDGFDLIRWMQTVQPEQQAAPVIALSAFADPHYRERTRSAGFAAHFEKPVDLPELFKVLRRLSGQPPGGPPQTP